MTETVRRYFAARARRYHAASTRWPWAWVRRREKAGVVALMGEVADDDLLDLGAGAGFYARVFLAHGARHAVAVDIAPEMVSALPGEGITGVVGDAATVDLGRRFRRVVCAGLLEFVPDSAAVLANARRHADDEAVMILLVPFQSIWGRLYRWQHHRRGLKIALFTPNDLSRLAKDTGWQADSWRRVFPFALVMRLRPAT